MTSSSTAALVSSNIHKVDVGEDGLTFDPDTLHVSPGGKVEFHFYPGNHSVAQAAFDNPCHPMSTSSFFSGFHAPTHDESSTVFTLTVNDTDPIWFYCGQVGHCQAGMVGVINPSGANTLDSFKNAASNADGITVPSAVQGGVLGKNDETESSTSSGASTGTASSTETESSTSSGASTGTASSTESPSPSAANAGAKSHSVIDMSCVLVLSFLMGLLLM
ncbi:cupredoxin [Penicillium argentinense]|uniref:Cupredoxin n=1 Tax=Penicillium argentinense TaxID=1131581 RepID=A0A9W9G0D8_9EURO|nr:cupredoxin [Penicillium argentinense]KAJ5109668.1 cupredoxin [Penicillium argentinense]